MQIHFWVSVLISFGYIPRNKIAWTHGNSIFNFLSTFQIVFHSDGTQLHSRQQYGTAPFPPHLPQHLLYLFGDGHSDRCEVVVHCGLICFPEDYWCWASFHVSVDHLYDLFGEMSIQILCLFFKFCFYFIFLLLSCVSSLYNMGSNYLPCRWFASISSHSARCLSWHFLLHRCGS